MTTSGSTKKTRRSEEPSDSDGAITTAAGKKQAEERVAVGVNVVYEAIRREGKWNCSVLRRRCGWVFPFSLNARPGRR
jgi:hypothetical protein